MHRGTLALLLAAQILGSCDAGNANPQGPDALSGLPLTDAIRAELSQSLAAFDDPDLRRSCSENEIAFLRTSLIGYGVFIGEEQTAPWTASERKAVEALMQRWNSLGGDGREVSDRCSQAEALLAGK
ncbi:hypothetical protein ACRDNQ_17425 [Palleronia sp. KMU-117]|uniref:hypothetical protein n=1 Tax=Palleronia sp. KMU-117 TaxID=3434108 RepID=UPI003D715D84